MDVILHQGDTGYEFGVGKNLHVGGDGICYISFLVASR